MKISILGWVLIAIGVVVLIYLFKKSNSSSSGSSDSTRVIVFSDLYEKMKS